MTKYKLVNCYRCGAVAECRQITEDRYMLYEYTEGIKHSCERIRRQK